MSTKFWKAGLAMAGWVDSGRVAVGWATPAWVVAGDAHAANIPSNNPVKAQYYRQVVNGGDKVKQAKRLGDGVTW